MSFLMPILKKPESLKSDMVIKHIFKPKFMKSSQIKDNLGLSHFFFKVDVLKKMN